MRILCLLLIAAMPLACHPGRPARYVQHIAADTAGAPAKPLQQSASPPGAGNSKPEVRLHTTANTTFYWNKHRLDYKVTVSDPEDGNIDTGRIQVSLDYLPTGKDLALHPGAVQGPLPPRGTLTLAAHPRKDSGGIYLLMAAYTDKGANGSEPLTGRDHITLRPPLVQVADYDEGKIAALVPGPRPGTTSARVRDGDYIKFSRFDLRDVRYIRCHVLPGPAGGSIEVRLNSPSGRLLGAADVHANPAGTTPQWREVKIALQPAARKKDLYFLFAGGQPFLFYIHSLRFEQATGHALRD